MPDADEPNARGWSWSFEPDTQVGRFLAHPPQDFRTGLTRHGVPWFDAPLDLLTTLDDDLRRRLRGTRAHRLLGRMLRWRTVFVGTTVTEYLPLPDGLAPQDLVTDLLQGELAAQCRGRRLLIVKDLPADGALIGAAAFATAQHHVEVLRAAGFVLIEGQALAWVPINFSSQAQYLARLSYSRRKNIRRKLRSGAGLDIECLATGDVRLADEQVRREFYRLYLQVYGQSDTHFDLLTPAFFDAVLLDPRSGGRLFVYREADRIVGWNLCYEVGDALVDKYIGFDYARSRALNLYIVSWMANLEYARKHGLRRYIAGWTDPQIKAELGARFTFTRHAVYARNPLLRWLLRRLGGVFEGDRQWFEKHERHAPGP